MTASLAPGARVILFVAVAVTAFSTMGVSIRLAAEELPVLVVVFFRNLLAIFIIAPPLLWASGVASLRTTHLKLHLARNAIGACAMASGFTAVTLIPLAEAQAIGFTAPLFATLGAALLLSERLRVYRMTALGVGFIGVAIVLAPRIGFGEGAVGGLGYGLALLSAIAMGASSLLMKRLADVEDAAVVALWMVLLQTPISLAPALAVWEWPSLATFGWLTLLAAAGTIGHIFYTRAARIAEISALQPFDFLKLPLAALWGAALFGEAPTLALWLGGAVIFGATLYIVRREATLGVSKPTARRVVE